ncbi:MAG: DUF192 domain-containing protein [Patescibacteria group bacterium]
MKTGWFIAVAGSFYLFVVALFWPVEKQMAASGRLAVDANGYGRATVVFSDASVHALVPTTTALQELGLAGRTQLTDVEGMLWIFDPPQRPSFWMKGMIIPLDFVWLNSGRIVDLTSDVSPPIDPSSTNMPIIEPIVPVDRVLEVAAGFASRHGLRVGDEARVDMTE